MVSKLQKLIERNAKLQQDFYIVSQDFQNLYEDIQSDVLQERRTQITVMLSSLNSKHYSFSKACKFTRNCYSTVFTETVVSVYSMHVYTVNSE